MGIAIPPAPFAQTTVAIAAARDADTADNTKSDKSRKFDDRWRSLFRITDNNVVASELQHVRTTGATAGHFPCLIGPICE